MRFLAKTGVVVVAAWFGSASAEPCPAGNLCLQVGSGALVRITDALAAARALLRD